MRIPRTLIPEVVSQVVTVLNISGMLAFAMNSKFQMPWFDGLTMIIHTFLSLSKDDI
jgi:hypothetical protein